MQHSTRLAALVQERLSQTFENHRAELEQMGDDILPMIDELEAFLQGGKRLRAQFATLGYQSISPLDLFADPEHELGPALDAACALELFQAAALVHDDVIDRSDTRRGRPAAHKHFASLHQANSWKGDAEHFGVSAAILLGDLLQSWSDELMQRACVQIADRHATTQAMRATNLAASRRARAHYNRMRTEVALGQYLDVFEEQMPVFADQENQLERSTRILVYKSAKYSVEAPLLIGAALAGATEAQENALSDFGLPVGVAFQLRDDLLGVFGDSELTGKPTGDDLIEGKRTVLVTLARSTLQTTQQHLFDELLGDQGLQPEQVEMLQRTIRESGAVDRVEHMITRNVDRAEASLDFAPLDTQIREQLHQLALKATRRFA